MQNHGDKIVLGMSGESEWTYLTVVGSSSWKVVRKPWNDSSATPISCTTLTLTLTLSHSIGEHFSVFYLDSLHQHFLRVLKCRLLGHTSDRRTRGQLLGACIVKSPWAIPMPIKTGEHLLLKQPSGRQAVAALGQESGRQEVKRRSEL